LAENNARAFMIVKEVAITTPHGSMDGYAAYPDGGGPFPLVALFMDVWGLREELNAIARRVAAQGYYCLLPNLFYRDGRIRYERRNVAGKAVSFVTLPEAMKKEMQSLAFKVDRPSARVDIAAMLDFCRNEPVDPGPVGSVGFCLGGREIFYAGQEFPERFRANACLHGTALVTDAPDSPHRLVGHMRGEVYCGYGERDSFATPDIIAALGHALGGRADLVYRFNVHAGVNHGYALPDRDVYDHAAAKADWHEIFAMFGRQLKSSARNGSLA
jgi:carboxymethylenebutenolidase